MSVTISRQSAAPSVAFQPSTYAELVQFAQAAARSSMVPKDYTGKPENVMIAVQMGAELGLRPMQSLQNISVINGRPSVWGDALLGLVRANALCQDVIETIEGEGDAMVAVCIVKRSGSTQVESRFSAADAKKAGLLGKPGPWQQYPKRMLQMRARGFAVRDAFPDVLRGLITSEEAADIPVETFNGPTIVAHAEPALEHTPAPEVRRSVREILRDKLAVATSADDVAECARIPAVAKILAEGPDAQRAVLNGMLTEAFAKFPEPADDVTDVDVGEMHPDDAN